VWYSSSAEDKGGGSDSSDDSLDDVDLFEELVDLAAEPLGLFTSLVIPLPNLLKF
jgi:hypothetical protein